MHALSRRHRRLVGAMLIAAIIVGGTRLPAIAQDTGAATAAEAATGAYNRGLSLFHNERYEEALPYFVAAKDEAAAYHGEGSSDYATALNNLAELYRLMERYDDAEPLFREALAIEENRLGPNDPGLAWPLNNLALLLRAQGHYAEAERVLKRSLALLEDTLGRRHPEVAGSMNNLARLYETMGLNERALPLLERSLMIAEDTLGPTHPNTRQIGHNLARVSAALSTAPTANGERPADQVAVAEADRPVVPGPPTELVLRPADRPASPVATPLPRPPRQPDAPEQEVAAALPEPAAGPATMAATEPAADPEPVATTEVAPIAVVPVEVVPVEVVPVEVVETAPDEEATAAMQTAEALADEADAAAEQVALLLPLPEARPSGRRWAKLPTGRFAVHLASVRSPISATEEWARLSDELALPDEVGQLEPTRIEVAEQGVFYRVLGGPFPSRDEAVRACQPIREQGDYCAVLGHGD